MTYTTAEKNAIANAVETERTERAVFHGASRQPHAVECAALCLDTFGGMSRDYAGPRYGHGAYCDDATTYAESQVKPWNCSDDIANIAY